MHLNFLTIKYSFIRLGRSLFVADIFVNSSLTEGYKSNQWNAINDLGQPLTAGMYIYKIQAGEFRQAKKMKLLK